LPRAGGALSGALLVVSSSLARCQFTTASGGIGRWAVVTRSSGLRHSDRERALRFRRGRSAKSRAVADLRVGARGRSQHHSAAANNSAVFIGRGAPACGLARCRRMERRRFVTFHHLTPTTSERRLIARWQGAPCPRKGILPPALHLSTSIDEPLSPHIARTWGRFLEGGFVMFQLVLPNRSTVGRFAP